MGTTIRAYKMTYDSGFAPNPGYGGGIYLTLATCKPGIRRCHKEGDWLAGFTSKGLCGDPVGEERLIYLAKVNKSIPISVYSTDYPKNRIDNIFSYENGEYHLIKTDHHKEDMKATDLSGINVLIADEFYYFGGQPLEIPENIRIPVPNRAAYGRLTSGKQADVFIEWVKQQAGGKSGKIHEPKEPPTNKKGC